MVYRWIEMQRSKLGPLQTSEWRCSMMSLDSRLHEVDLQRRRARYLVEIRGQDGSVMERAWIILDGDGKLVLFDSIMGRWHLTSVAAAMMSVDTRHAMERPFAGQEEAE
jgi:hypothetical protein